ncbi:helix-turn-helix protein [Nocardioides albertanoniae]|uniref:Helix-turn-helix protein n=1 Tax=Nocardioides albertanoniae TaxID=1175486 RepID=A0A543A3V1_9ACTN|nr:helix-turn-helix domain-containing protein [Nocardioides albertanoniae]TQL67242.1 helix-turn-helix protein [Nocardioides albertanoniae]
MAPQGDISTVVAHPVRLRILHAVGSRDQTTAELQTLLPDVPQATLYRHISVLVKAEVLAVASERRVRGAVERTYTLGERMAHVDQAELSTLSDEQVRAAFLAFVGELLRTFEDSLGLGEVARSHLGFGSGPLYVDEDDLARIQEGFNALISPHLEQVDDKQRVMLSTVLLPTE